MGELIIAVGIGRILLYRIVHLQNGRIFACFCIEDTHTVGIFHGEIDILKDFLSLASCAECCNRYCHSNQQGDEKEYYI